MVRVLIAFGCALLLLVVGTASGYLSMDEKSEGIAINNETPVDRSELNFPALFVGSGFVVIGALAALAVCDRQAELEVAAQ